MMRRAWLIVLGMVLLPFSGKAQQPWCAQEEMTHRLLEKDPQVVARVQARAAAQQNAAPMPEGGVRIIPVVVHIVHQNGAENISDTYVHQAIERLNKDFRAMNSDTSMVRSMFKPLIADMNFEFRLAGIDPAGNCTNGIVREYNPATDQGADAAIKTNYWPTNKYLNIYVVKRIGNSSSGGIILGYAYLPFMAAGEPHDGIVILASEMNSFSRTLTHEVGHYLGLLHTFQSGCTSSGDGVDDTPPVANPNFGCPWSVNSCHTDSPDLKDQIENYMDYSSCQAMFTHGQKQRVDYYHQIYRTVLTSAANLQATGVVGTYSCKPLPQFEVSEPAVCTQTPLTITNTSQYQGNVSFSWDFPGATPSTSTDEAPTVTYANPGVYPISLTVSQNGYSRTYTRQQAVVVYPSTPLINHQAWLEPVTPDIADWMTPPNPAGRKWKVVSSAAYSPPYSLMVENYQKNNAGEEFSYVLPPVDMRLLDEKTLRFKYAHARYDGRGQDLLAVFVSTDCGKTWRPKWFAGGSQLATIQGLYLRSFVPSSLSDWDSVTVDLSAYGNEPNVLIRFLFRSGGQNNIYLDDIQLGRNLTGLGPDAFQPSQVVITADAVRVMGRRLPVIELLHADGRLVKRRRGRSLPLNGLPPGAYLVRVSDGVSARVWPVHVK